MDLIYLFSVAAVIVIAIGNFLIVLKQSSAAQSPVQVSDYSKLLQENLAQKQRITDLSDQVAHLSRTVDEAQTTIQTLQIQNKLLHEQITNLYSRLFDMGGIAVMSQQQEVSKRLAEMLPRHFDMSDLEILAGDIGIEWDQIPHGTLQVAAKNLTDFCMRRGPEMLEQLRTAARKARPAIQGW